MPCAFASERSIKRLLCKDSRRSDQLIEVRSRTVKNVSFALTHAAAARILSAICVSTVCVIVRINACVWWGIRSKQHTSSVDYIYFLNEQFEAIKGSCSLFVGLVSFGLPLLIHPSRF